jgi:ectoine hydroxylase-related dioxygenase (phytanoyl-CoA dioxygenase family)
MQDVDASMGPTLFLPNTNNEHDHAQHKNPKTKDKFLASCVYKQGLLKKGDLVIMDSRTMHCGTGNDSGKRVLLYFTLNNPNFHETPPPRGSKFEDLHLTRSGLEQQV